MSHLSHHGWGKGGRVVLVHGSLATGADEWPAQRPLVDEGFLLIVPDRRGYGGSPPTEGEDFVRDGDDVAALMGDGAHLVGHSYGGLGAMLAAAKRPEATLSLALLEPPVFDMAQQNPAARGLVEEVKSLWQTDLPDEEWLVRFLAAVGSDTETLPREALTSAAPLVPLVRRSRPAWDADLPVDRLASTRFPKLVVSGGHSEAFDAICDDLAEAIGATRAEVEGAGHEIQAAPPINETLLGLWRSAA